MREALGTVPNALQSPAPQVEVLTVNAAGSILAIRPFCRHDHYWQVYFDTNRAISRVLLPDQGFQRAS